MSFSAVPTNWLPGYLQDGTYMKMAYTDFPQVTTTEGNSSTGDIRKIYFGLAEGMYQSYNAKAAADRPTRMALYKSTSADPVTGVITVTYTMTFQNAILTQDVIAE